MLLRQLLLYFRNFTTYQILGILCVILHNFSQFLIFVSLHRLAISCKRMHIGLIITSDAWQNLSDHLTQNSSGQRNFDVCGPVTWNSLPANLRCPSLTIKVFTQRLKSFLMDSCAHWEFGSRAPNKYLSCIVSPAILMSFVVTCFIFIQFIATTLSMVLDRCSWLFIAFSML